MMNYKHKRQQQQQRPRLDRRNAVKNIDYDADGSSSSLPSPSSNSFSDDRSVYKTRSLDLLPLSGCTSFRIEGIEGEVDHIFQFLGLDPEDFSIPVADWEARNSSSPSSNLKTVKRGDRSGLSQLSDCFDARIRVSDGEMKDIVDVNLDDIQVSVDEVSEIEVKNKLISLGRLGIIDIKPPTHSILGASDPGGFSNDIGARVKIGNGEAKNATDLILDSDEARAGELSENNMRSEFGSNGGWGIRGNRPPKLAPPPVMMRSVVGLVVDDMSSTWDIFNAFGPQDAQDLMPINEVEEYEDGERQEANKDAAEKKRGVGLESCSDSSNDERDGDSVPLIGESDHTISPSGSFRRNIMSWQKGDFLGSGSFGTVYEGFTDDGLFFAVKEVSLLDQGSQGQQSIYQLEQEISFLREFQHKNIVRYLGTDKDHAKLYIFLELVTKGSLAKLYEKYQLRDSQVSSYTRQILSGLNYLHCRNVVHRDIKCANILVDVSGSVKLADFGLAKATKLNDIKSCKGTPFWMAPEVVKHNNRGYGRAADIWSLGCTVLEMLTRQIPYSHLEGMQALFRIGRGELPPIPNTLSKDAQDFILKCLQVNPDDRATAAQLLDHPFVKKPSSTFLSPASPHYGTQL